MPLYNNILLSRKSEDDGAENPPTKNDSNASMKLLQDHLLSKRRQQQQTNSSHKQSKDKINNSNEPRLSQVISETKLHHPTEDDWELEDEYDPMIPNNYELLQAEYLKARGQSNVTSKPAQTPGGKKTIPNLLKVLDALDEEDGNDLDLSNDLKIVSKGTAVAPPPSLVITSLDSSLPTVEHESESVIPKDTTRVLLLQNMVGPGEVDDDLEAETKEECKKYGDVIKCLIYEIPSKQVPDEEAVRIFIEFRQVESAMRAASDLNGRYFGGRVVRASFYSQDRFSKYDLGAQH